jgi:hypothetical protein
MHGRSFIALLGIRRNFTPKPMPERTRIANARKSRVRSAVEHVFAHQKCLMGLFVRTISLARARLKIGIELRRSRRRKAWFRVRRADPDLGLFDRIRCAG